MIRLQLRMMKGGEAKEGRKLQTGTVIKGKISKDKKKGQHSGRDWRARDNNNKKKPGKRGGGSRSSVTY